MRVNIREIWGDYITQIRNNKGQFANNLADVTVLLCISISTFLYQLTFTTFWMPINYDRWEKRLLILLIVAVAVKLCTRYKDKMLWLAIPPAVVFFLAWPYEHYIYQALFAFMLVGCVGISVRKIICAAAIPSSLVIIIMMFASLDGAIYSMVYLARNMRSYWGNISSTDFGTAVLLIVIFAWLIFKSIPDEYFLLLSLFSLFISFYVTRSNTSGYLTILFMIILLYRIFERRIIEKKNKCQCIRSCVNALMLIAFSLLGIAIITLAWAYNREIPIAKVINVYSHSRIDIAAKMLARYGLHPFGTYFDMVGNGGSTIGNIAEYTFIDSSYPQILIRYGWVTYIVANILWVITIYRAIKSGNRRIAFAMAIMSVNFVMEHHYYELTYNPFIILPFADFAVSSDAESKIVTALRKKWEAADNSKFRIAFILTVITCMAICFALLPTAFSWLRTIFNGHGMSGGGRGGVKVFIVITVILTGVTVFICAISSIIGSLVAKEKIGRYRFMAVSGMAVVCLVGLVRMDHMIDQVRGFISDRTYEEREIIDIIKDNKSGKLYVDRFPEVYVRDIGGIDRSYMCGEDFARSDNATVIVDAWNDSRCFQGRGFLYLPISEWDAIYTNDQAVIEALKDKGYILKGYNTYEYHVDLRYLADLNELQMSEKGGLLLQGEDHYLKDGPYIEINPGEFTATYELRTDNIPYTDDHEICVLKVNSYNGQKVLAETSINRSMFDEKGELSFELPFNGNGKGYGFTVQLKKDINIEVVSISYRRTPAFDLHVKVDDEGRVIHEEYYDLTGEPYKKSNESYGADYAYNDHDKPIITRLLGEDLNPIIGSEGYAEIHRIYDETDQPISESYYGLMGEPIELKGGYHTLEREFDYAGNCIEERYYDTNGERTLYNNAYWKIVKRYNDQRKNIHEEYYGTDDEQIDLKSGYAGANREYDSAGNVISITYLGKDGEPVYRNTGVSRTDYELYDTGMVKRESNYAPDGTPVCNSSGVSATEYTYDKYKRIESATFYGTDGKESVNLSGFSRIVYKRDDAGRTLKESYYGPTGEPISCTGGYWCTEYEYDDKGNVITITYEDAIGEPILNTSRVAIINREHDGDRRVIKELYLDTLGQYTLNTAGVSGYKRKYDVDGRSYKETYLDERENVKPNNAGIATIHRIYNEYNLLIREDYYDVDYNRILNTGGYAGVGREYDVYDRIASLTYYDDSDAVVMLNSGIASEEYEYDDAWQTVEINYKDKSGNPVTCTRGYAGIIREYDGRYIIAERFLDGKGKIVRTTDDYSGQFREYDEVGNYINTIYVDENNDPVLNTSGIAMIKREYDEARNCIWEGYYDMEGKLIDNTSGRAEIYRTYDRDRNVIETRMLNTAGETVE